MLIDPESPHNTLLERQQDDSQTIEIWQGPSVQGDLVRWMSFGDTAIQSAYQLNNPTRLLLPYTQALFSGLLFAPRPRRVLVLGLAGGALARWLRAQFPQMAITAVEKSPIVNKLCRRWFPLDTPYRIDDIQLIDARDFLRTSTGQFDWILVDVAQTENSPPWLCENEFLLACQQRLSANGLLAMNLLPRDNNHLHQQLSSLRGIFTNKTLVLDVPGHRNIVTLAGAPDVQTLSMDLIHQRARSFSVKHDLPWQSFARRIAAINPPGSGLRSHSAIARSG